MKKHTTIEKDLGCKFIRIDPDKDGIDSFRSINEIFTHMKRSTKKTPKNKI